MYQVCYGRRGTAFHLIRCTEMRNYLDSCSDNSCFEPFIVYRPPPPQYEEVLTSSGPVACNILILLISNNRFPIQVWLVVHLGAPKLTDENSQAYFLLVVPRTTDFSVNSCRSINASVTLGFSVCHSYWSLQTIVRLGSSQRILPANRLAI